MSLNPRWEEVTPQCASSKWKGTLSQCYSSPTVWVALGTAVVDLLCVARSYRLPYRKDQEVYTGRWKGQLLWRFGRDPNSSVIRRDSEWPTERERLGDVTSRRHSCCTTAGRPGLRLGSSAKTWLMRCTGCLLYSRCDQRQLDAMIACQCPLARLVTLEVDRSLWRDPNSSVIRRDVSVPSFRERGLHT